MPMNDPRTSPTADVIRRFEFATVRRGYDPDQVRDYLETIATRVEALEGDLKAAEAALDTAKRQAAASGEAAAQQPDPYDAFAKRFAGLLGTADREAERLVEEAKAESTRILDEARMDADRIRVDAQDRAEEARTEGRRALEEARAEADRALSSLAARRQQLVDQLQAMQARLISAAEDLEVVIEDDPVDLPAPVAEAEAEAATPDADVPEGPAPGPEEAAEPGYEDLWVASDGDATDLPDLASIEFDFDEDHAPD
jgi:DivIVA domain-containing protein